MIQPPQYCSWIKHLAKTQHVYSTAGPQPKPLSPLKKDKTPEAMIVIPYSRDEIIASVTGFYDFLTFHLQFSPSELKTPSPIGWPQIVPPREDRPRKLDTTIELLYHLPYLSDSNAQEK